MADTEELRDGVARDAVIRSFARAVERACARPSCGAPARATLTFRYGTREAWIERLSDRRDPQAYDLCATHAARTRPPQGWDLRDRRPEDERRPDVPHTTPVDLGGDRTVAVLAAALRSVPDPVSEDAIADDAEVDRDVVALPPAAHSPFEESDGEPPVPDPPVLDLGLATDLERDPEPAEVANADLGSGSVALLDPDHVDVSSPDTDAVTGGPRPPLAARRRDTLETPPHGTPAHGAAADW